jgi:outer membrane protein OmpA-like peptidoglycan-associated protein
VAFGPDQAFVFGLSAGATFPSGGSANFLGDRSVTGRVRALLEYQASERFRALVMLGGLLREKSQAFQAVMGNQMLYGAAVDFRVLPDMSVLGEINGRIGSWTYVDGNPAECDVAMRAYLPAMFSLLMGVGVGVDHGVGSPMFRGFVGVGWAPDFRDRDHDGIIDSLDRCPDEPEDKDGFQDDDGCPDEDNDNDGIPDAVDKCPNQPETFNHYKDEDGCPDEVPAEVKKFTGVIEGINFKTGSAEILPGSFSILDRALKVLQDFPDVNLEISGHTDSKGKAMYNLNLSQNRANSVKLYFVSRGIASTRLLAVGFGKDRPIADNSTTSGRATNRRTEFRLISPGDSK